MIKNTKLSTKKIAITGMLGAFTVLLSITPMIGYIPLPILHINATTMHIPVIIGAILGGPLVGTMVGLIFGVSSFLRAGSPAVADPLVSIPPRLLIGITSYFAYKVFKHPVAAAIAGTLTNTIGVLSMIYIRGYLPLEVVIATAGTNGIAEVIISSIIVYIVVRALKNYKID